ncbi:hypothetical protein C8Q80DRAFT_1172841, partial [Daedaleopsis nitida]
MLSCMPRALSSKFSPKSKSKSKNPLRKAVVSLPKRPPCTQRPACHPHTHIRVGEYFCCCCYCTVRSAWTRTAVLVGICIVTWPVHARSLVNSGLPRLVHMRYSYNAFI